MTGRTKYSGRVNPKRKRKIRRKYIVDRRKQLAATVRIGALVLVLLLALNIVIAWQSYTAATQIMSTDPDIGERLHLANQRNIAVLAGISLVILAMVVVRSIMLTHRTSGAVVKIAQSFEKISEGDLEFELRLRAEDSLKPVEDGFNEMTEMLRLQAKSDQRAMDKLADDIEEHGNPVDAEMLRRLAASRGKTSG
jgi:methyl-accepting chemotaxis protein